MNPNFSHQKEDSTNTQQAEIDKLYEQIVADQVDHYLKDDIEYQVLATPLKSAGSIKEEHRNQIKEELEQKELRNHINRAYDLIMDQLPSRLSPLEFDKLKEEFANSVDHFQKIHQKQQESLAESEPMQEIFGISNESMEHIYQLASFLLENKEFKDAESVLSFLILLNPFITFFWTSLGTSLQSQSRYEEAINIFEMAQVLDPTEIDAFILAAESHLQLNHKEEAGRLLKTAEEILLQSQQTDKQNIANQIQFLKNQL